MPEASGPTTGVRPALGRRALRIRGGALLSLITVTMTIAAFLAFTDQVWHWFILPVAACGVLIGLDAVSWLRGCLDLFDPVGILGALGFHFFFLAPLLHVASDYWMGYIVPPPDWRPWLGAMATLNLAGLLVYRLVRGRLAPLSAKPAVQRRVWHLDWRRFRVILPFSLAVTLALQLLVYGRMGGVMGYVKAFEAREGAFTGMGWVFAISESFPILAYIRFAAQARRTPQLRTWGALVVSLLAFLVLKLLFGGLRGSRSNTIWGLFWAVGIVHLWLRRIPRRAVWLGLGFLVLFMYVYGFYKAMGSEGMAAITDANLRSELAQSGGRSLDTVLLADLGRSDVQAFLLYRLSRPFADYRYAWGRTYLGAVALLVPAQVWPARPPGKVKEGTEVQYGMGTWVPDVWSSSRVYGLAGEAMLNFGPVAVPFSFALLALVVGRVRRWAGTMDRGDARLLLLPLAVSLCFVILTSDSDNVVFNAIKDGLVPLLVIVACCQRLPMNEVRLARQDAHHARPRRASRGSEDVCESV